MHYPPDRGSRRPHCFGKGLPSPQQLQRERWLQNFSSFRLTRSHWWTPSQCGSYISQRFIHIYSFWLHCTHWSCNPSESMTLLDASLMRSTLEIGQTLRVHIELLFKIAIHILLQNAKWMEFIKLYANLWAFFVGNGFSVIFSLYSMLHKMIQILLHQKTAKSHSKIVYF